MTAFSEAVFFALPDGKFDGVFDEKGGDDLFDEESGQAYFVDDSPAQYLETRQAGYPFFSDGIIHLK